MTHGDPSSVLRTGPMRVRPPPRCPPQLQTRWWNLLSAQLSRASRSQSRCLFILETSSPSKQHRWPVSTAPRTPDRGRARAAAACSPPRRLMAAGVSSGEVRCTAACCSRWCTPSWACRCRTAGSQRKRWDRPLRRRRTCGSAPLKGGRESWSIRLIMRGLAGERRRWTTGTDNERRACN